MDLERDWARLGHRPPSRAKKWAKQIPERTMKFLEFLFTWIGKAWDDVWNKFTSPETWITVLAACGIVGVGAWAYQSAHSDGRIDYCLVDEDKKSLIGHRPWSFNVNLRHLREGETINVLYQQAKEIGCPLR